MARTPVDTLARQHTEQAIETIREVMINSWEPRDRLAAAKEMLDRGHGKPLNAIISIPANRAQAALLAQMTDEDLMRVIQDAPLPRLRGPEPLDAEFEVVPERDPLLA